MPRRRTSAALVRVAATAVAAAALALPPAAAHAGPPFTPAGSTDGVPFADGTAIVWQAAGPALASRVPGSGETRRFPLAAPDCELRDVAAPRYALVQCPRSAPATADVVDTRTGRLLARPAIRESVRVERLGAAWITGTWFGPCYHCETTELVSWRTGERRSYSFEDERSALDLDRTTPTRQRLATHASRGGVSIVQRGGDPVSVFRGDALVARVPCPFVCGQHTVWRGPAAWIEDRASAGDPPERLHEIVVRSARRRSWDLTRVRGGTSDRARTLGAGDALYLAVPVDREGRRHRVHRAR